MFLLLGHKLEHGSTVAAVSYTEIMRSKLKPAIRSNRRGLLSRGFVCFTITRLPHSAAAACEAVRQLKSELPPHLSCIPYLTPSEYGASNSDLSVISLPFY